MTSEVAIEWLNTDISRLWNTPMNNLHKEALEMAIKALENQCPSKGVDCEDCPANEPCEDAISRKAVLDIIRFEDKWLTDAKSNNADTDIAFSGIKSKVTDLPPIQPKAKVGYWKTFEVIQSGLKETWYQCSICKWENALLLPRKYCPNCGAKMEVDNG